LRVKAISFNEDDALGRCGDRQTAGEETVGRLGLKRREPEPGLAISRDHELDEPVAQIADAVEEDDRLHTVDSLCPSFSFFVFR
jgi:hypothetical protein